jgi:two-component system phosphate regulon sensor histidine kinase PhoR
LKELALRASRLESDLSEKNAHAFDLQELVKRSISAVKSTCHEKQLELEFEPDDASCLFEGDAQSISQLVDNLMDNAIKYTPAGGKISVRLSRTADLLQLEVEDTGIGIEAQAQQRVFERFYRVDKARSRDLGGTGLGLSIVKHIAEEHGGSVQLDSQPGRGSRFIVKFPLTP